MKFLIIRRADQDTEAGIMPSDALLMAMGNYNQSMAAAGVMLDGTGLKPSSAGARVDFTDGRPVVTDGPFAETKELIAGFSLIEVDSKEEAIEWARKWPKEDAGGNVSLELRQLFEMDDFDDGAGKEVHEVLRKQMARRPQSSSHYLLFNGNCAQAFHFYADLFGGSIDFAMTFGDAPGDHGVPQEWNEKLIHAHLNIGRYSLMGSDAPPGRYSTPQGFFVQMEMPSVAETQRVYDALADGATIHMPLGRTFWSESFAMLVDRFGIPWMINHGGEAQA